MPTTASTATPDNKPPPAQSPEPGADGNEDPGSEADTLVPPLGPPHPGGSPREPVPVIRPTPG